MNMTEYIYDIIKVLSGLDFSVWDYIKDNGLQVTSAAHRYYSAAQKKPDISDNEAKEIARFLRYRYQDKCRSFLWNSLIQLREGPQVVEGDLEGVRLVFSVEIQDRSIQTSLVCPFKSKTSIYEESTDESYLIQTAAGKMPNKVAREKILRDITVLLERRL